VKFSPELTCVATRIKKLQKELSDAEWENSPNVGFLRHELEHFTSLAKRGIVYEPNF
jgi:hypothetical protein